MSTHSPPSAPLAASNTVARVDRARYYQLARRAKLLSWASLAYMAFEGGVAILAGALAGSVALIGFGLDSAIEGFASAIIIWRFTAPARSRRPQSNARRSSSPCSSSSSRPTWATSRPRRC
jgi:hypothetical protein